MQFARAKRRWFFGCVLLWLVSLVAGQALHAAAHDADRSGHAPTTHHSCLVCQLYQQTALPAAGDAASLALPIAEGIFVCRAIGSDLPAQTSRHPLVPRGPPASS